VRRASYFLLATLVTFMLGGWMPSAVSMGGQKRCDQKGISAADLDKVRAPAAKTAAPHHLDWRSAFGCTHSRGAWVDIDIVDEPQADGSLITGAAWCQREKVGNWECEYAKGRHYRMNVMVAGKPRTLDTMIPEEISVQAVTRMMQQAIDVAPGLTMAQVCGMPTPVDQAADPPWLAALEEIHRDFQLPVDQPFAHIVDWGGHWTVAVGENELEFAADPGGTDGFKFSCWSITIHV